MEVRYCACNKLLHATKLTASSATWTARVERLMGSPGIRTALRVLLTLGFDSISILILTLLKSDLVTNKTATAGMNFASQLVKKIGWRYEVTVYSPAYLMTVSRTVFWSRPPGRWFHG